MLFCHPPSGIDAREFNRTTFKRYKTYEKRNPVQQPKQPETQDPIYSTEVSQPNPNMRIKKKQGKKVKRRERERMRGVFSIDFRLIL